MERGGFKGTKTGITVFGQFVLSGSQPKFIQLDTFYKQLSINNLMEEETQPGSYGEKSDWINLNIMINYNFFNCGPIRKSM